jgi:hypothetical protein
LPDLKKTVRYRLRALGYADYVIDAAPEMDHNKCSLMRYKQPTCLPALNFGGDENLKKQF